MVKSVKKSKSKSVFEITFQGGVKVKSTEDHPFYVLNKGWSSISPSKSKSKYRDQGDLHSFSKLEVNDFCVFKEGDGEWEEFAIISIERLDKRERSIFTLELSSKNNFLANNILVHNKTWYWWWAMGGGGWRQAQATDGRNPVIAQCGKNCIPIIPDNGYCEGRVFTQLFNPVEDEVLGCGPQETGRQFTVKSCLYRGRCVKHPYLGSKSGCGTFGSKNPDPVIVNGVANTDCVQLFRAGIGVNFEDVPRIKGLRSNLRTAGNLNMCPMPIDCGFRGDPRDNPTVIGPNPPKYINGRRVRTYIAACEVAARNGMNITSLSTSVWDGGKRFSARLNKWVKVKIQARDCFSKYCSEEMPDHYCKDDIYGPNENGRGAPGTPDSCWVKIPNPQTKELNFSPKGGNPAFKVAGEWVTTRGWRSKDPSPRCPLLESTCGIEVIYRLQTENGVIIRLDKAPRGGTLVGGQVGCWKTTITYICGPNPSVEIGPFENLKVAALLNFPNGAPAHMRQKVRPHPFLQTIIKDVNPPPNAIFRPAKHPTNVVRVDKNFKGTLDVPHPRDELYFLGMGDAPCIYSGVMKKQAGGKFMGLKSREITVPSLWNNQLCPQGAVVALSPSSQNQSNASSSSLFARDNNLFHALGEEEERCLGGETIHVKVPSSQDASDLPAIIDYDGQCYLNEGSKKVNNFGVQFKKDNFQFKNKKAYNNSVLIELSPDQVIPVTDINECCNPPTPTIYPSSDESQASFESSAKPVNLELLDIPIPTPTISE